MNEYKAFFDTAGHVVLRGPGVRVRIRRLRPEIVGASIDGRELFAQPGEGVADITGSARLVTPGWEISELRYEPSATAAYAEAIGHLTLVRAVSEDPADDELRKLDVRIELAGRRLSVVSRVIADSREVPRTDIGWDVMFRLDRPKSSWVTLPVGTETKRKGKPTMVLRPTRRVSRLPRSLWLDPHDPGADVLLSYDRLTLGVRPECGFEGIELRRHRGLLQFGLRTSTFSAAVHETAFTLLLDEPARVSSVGEMVESAPGARTVLRHLDRHPGHRPALRELAEHAGAEGVLYAPPRRLAAAAARTNHKEVVRQFAFTAWVNDALTHWRAIALGAEPLGVTPRAARRSMIDWIERAEGAEKVYRAEAVCRFAWHAALAEADVLELIPHHLIEFAVADLRELTLEAAAAQWARFAAFLAMAPSPPLTQRAAARLALAFETGVKTGLRPARSDVERSALCAV